MWPVNPAYEFHAASSVRGEVQLFVPRGLSSADVRELEEWLELVIRSMKRRAELPDAPAGAPER